MDSARSRSPRVLPTRTIGRKAAGGSGSSCAFYAQVLALFRVQPFVLLVAFVGSNLCLVCTIPAVLDDMLRRLGLTVDSIAAPFEPERGAYHGHSHSSGHSHDSHNHDSPESQTRGAVGEGQP